MDKIKLIQETAKEMYGCSFDEIEQGGRSLLVLNRCLDIVLEQLELTAVVQAKPEKVCKGSMQLGTGCGACRRCQREIEHMSKL
jgi:hypothetical protein